MEDYTFIDRAQLARFLPDPQSITAMENLQRADLSEIEETEGLLKLLSMRLQRTLTETVSLLYRMDNEAKDKVTVQVLGSDDGRLVEATFSAISSPSTDAQVGRG